MVTIPRPRPKENNMVTVETVETIPDNPDAEVTITASDLAWVMDCLCNGETGDVFRWAHKLYIQIKEGE